MYTMIKDCPSSDTLCVEMIEKKYGDLDGTIAMVELTKGLTGLGLSLAGNRDRKKMSVFVCGMHPKGSAYKDGRIQVGDEILEVNGYAVFGRCHLNASAVIKSLDGPIFKIVILRRSSALAEMAVKPLTQFPVHLEEEINLEAKYSSQFTGRFTLRTVTVRKAREGLGIMIVEGRHADLGRGIFISGIQSNSPAEQSGLAIGDMILCVDQTDLVRADYETAATLLKNSEGLLSIVVAKTPKTSLKETSTSSHQLNSSTSPVPSSDTVSGVSVTSSGVSLAKILPLDQRKYSSIDASSSGLTLAGSINNNYNNNNDNLTLNKNQTQLDREQASFTAVVGGSTVTSNGKSKLKSIGVSSDTSSQFVTLHPNDTRSAVLGGPCDAKTCLVTPGHETVIEITKGHNAMGISVAGGIDTPLSYIVICEIYSNGAASTDGRLKPGDIILQVNGLDFRSVIHAQADNILKSVTGNTVTLVIYREIVEPHWFKPDITCHTLRPVVSSDVKCTEDNQLSTMGDANITSGPGEASVDVTDETNITNATSAEVTATGHLDATERESVDAIFPKLSAIEIELQKKSGKNLGLIIAPRKDASRLPIVTSIVSESIAESSGQIYIGDHLLELNGQNLTSLTYAEVVALMKLTSGKLCLKIGRFQIPDHMKR